MKLFCIHYGGGSQFSLVHLGKYLNPSIETIYLEVPGRGKRIREVLLTDLELMAEDIYHQVRPQLTNNEEYILFGHSLGGMLIFLLTRILREKGHKMPIHMIPSGVKAPKYNNDGKIIFHKLNDENFKKELFELGGIPKEVRQSKELLEFFLPILRADFTAIETYEYTEALPLTVPITALSGLDEDILEDDLMLWQNETTQPVKIQQFPGDHFFILDKFQEIGEIINEVSRKNVLEI